MSASKLYDVETVLTRLFGPNEYLMKTHGTKIRLASFEFDSKFAKIWPRDSILGGDIIFLKKTSPFVCHPTAVVVPCLLESKNRDPSIPVTNIQISRTLLDYIFPEFKLILCCISF